MTPTERDEAVKWLRLGYEAYGRSGAGAMARAMGLTRPADRADADRMDVEAPSDAGDVRAASATPERLDDLSSPNHRMVAIRSDGQPRVEVFGWAPVGMGESSFGHMSASIGDRMYSWGPGGMTTEPRKAYLRRNGFRSALSREVALPADEIAAFERSLQTYPLRHEYDTFLANCADPTEEAFEELGYPMGIRLSPRDVMEGLVGAGLSRPNDYRLRHRQPDADSRDADQSAAGKFSAPWSWLFR